MQKNPLTLAIPLFIALFALGMPFVAHAAETMDDNTIHTIYGDMKAAIHDPVKSREIMEKRFGPNYTVQSNVARIMGDGPPEKLTRNRNRQQAIDDVISNISKANLDSYDSNVTAIQYSGDKKYAYVTDVTTSSGTIDSGVQAAGQNVSLKFQAQEKCSHIVTLDDDGFLKIMQSQCDDQIKLVN